jgi:4-hydroxybenzoate polyprenyltransferase
MNKLLLPLLNVFFLLRPVVLIPVWGFALFGYNKGRNVNFSELPDLWRTTDVGVFLWIVIFSLSVGCVYVLNQIADIDVDRKNSGLPLLANGIVSRKGAYGAAGAAAIIAIAVPFCAGHRLISLLSLISIVIGILYSFRPFYFSGRPFLDFLTNAAGFGIVALGVGWHLAGRSMADPAFLPSTAPYFLLMCAGAISSTIPDIAGDRAGGKRTTAVVLGEKNAHCLATAAIMAAAVLSFLSKDTIAAVCAAAGLPLYLLYLLRPRKNFAEATYKIGGGLCMVAAAVIMPVFLLAGAAVFAATWIYFRFCHGVAYPSLTPTEKRAIVSGKLKEP